MPKRKRCAVAGKQYEVVRDFRHSNPKSPYEDTHYVAGDDYKHDVHDVQLSGPDSHGPVIKEKASSSSSAPAADSSGKGGN